MSSHVPGDVDTSDAYPAPSPPLPGSLVGNIAATIASDIVAGRLRAGADLNSDELARRFQTSRTPVREALLMLEKEGLVEIESRRRPRVKRWTRSEVRELYLVRAALYALVAELIVANAPDEGAAWRERRCWPSLLLRHRRRIPVREPSVDRVGVAAPDAGADVVVLAEAAAPTTISDTRTRRLCLDNSGTYTIRRVHILRW